MDLSRCTFWGGVTVTMSDNLENVFLRLGYALRELKNCNNCTIILGAGCSLGSTSRDISTIGIMRQCLIEHGVHNVYEFNWEALYQNFVNIVWEGKAKKEQELLLKKKLSGIKPSDGHRYLRSLTENGYITTIITTNFDMLLEETFEGLSYRKRVGDGEYKVIGDNPTFDLLKIHGDLEEGKFRFAPNELMKLPLDLQTDIEQKTSELLIFAGYRGQDIGLMNSLSTINAYATYWIDINAPSSIDVFSTKHIYEFMEQRESKNNFLYGKEFGDFHQILKKLDTLLVSPSHSNIIKSKETYLSNVWQNTSIIELLHIYTRIYELFLDILDLSGKVANKLICEDGQSFNYDEQLYSYLYFFNSKKLPSNLLHIPNNEVDALVLGVSIEVLVRTLVNGISPKDFINDLRIEFENIYGNGSLINDSFWLAVEKIVCSEVEKDNAINLNMKNNLTLKSFDVPLIEFNELLHVVQFLSLLVPTTPNNAKGMDTKNRIKQLLNGKYESLNILDSKINIDLGEINFADVDELLGGYLNNLPELRRIDKDEVTGDKKYLVFESKWINIKFEIKTKENTDSDNFTSLFALIQKRGKNTTQLFLKLYDTSNLRTDSHVNLQLDEDLKVFINSNRAAMFVVGTSGSGKSNAINNFLKENLSKEEIITVTISPKNTSIDKYGISLFMDAEISDSNIDSLLKNFNSSLELRESKLILIFDGLNEVNDAIEKQQLHYCYLLELAGKLHENSCENIKLIITCRESAYYQYKNLTNLQLNHACFYSNDKSETSLLENQDASYRVVPLSNRDKDKLITQYINSDLLEKLEKKNISAQLYFNNILKGNMTPLFIAIAGESLNSIQAADLMKDSDNIYDLFANAILGRIEPADEYLVKKIIYAYFNVAIKHWNAAIEVTRFKILDEIPMEYHNHIDIIINKMIDVNILLKDYTDSKKIKFHHDKIEEFFFKEYIEEYEYKGLTFFKDILELSNKNVIYQGGVLLYLITLIKKRKLKILKEISVGLSLNHMKLFPKLIVEALAQSYELIQHLEYLLNVDDYEDSKKMLNIIVWGLDESLQDYSIINYDLMNVISKLQAMPDNTVITSEIRASLWFFESKLYYFTNDYIKAEISSDKAVKLSSETNQLLLSKINVHRSVIYMELGYSKKSVELLEKEFELYKDSNDFKTILEIGIELGRALNHCGQIERTLALYDLLLKKEALITNPYVLARIYEQKANVLNNIMYEKLHHGFIHKEKLSMETLGDVRILFDEAILLYNKSMQLLLGCNAIFTYSGVVPEKINTYISYSYSLIPLGIEECNSMIKEVEDLFQTISTPFETDFYLSKAYYYEYINNFKMAEACISHALEKASTLNIRNKIAKCHYFFSIFTYRRLLNDQDGKERNTWIDSGLDSLNKAISYYENYTIKEGNTLLDTCITLKQKYERMK